jgi:hypothetical protein
MHSSNWARESPASSRPGRADAQAQVGLVKSIYAPQAKWPIASCWAWRFDHQEHIPAYAKAEEIKALIRPEFPQEAHGMEYVTE